MIRRKTGKRIASVSFWLIAAIHIAVFTAIGITVKDWKLLMVFLCGLVVVLAVGYSAKYILGKKRQRKTQ